MARKGQFSRVFVPVGWFSAFYIGKNLAWFDKEYGPKPVSSSLTATANILLNRAALTSSSNVQIKGGVSSGVTGQVNSSSLLNIYAQANLTLAPAQSQFIGVIDNKGGGALTQELSANSVGSIDLGGSLNSQLKIGGLFSQAGLSQPPNSGQLNSSAGIIQSVIGGTSNNTGVLSVFLTSAQSLSSSQVLSSASEINFLPSLKVDSIASFSQISNFDQTLNIDKHINGILPIVGSAIVGVRGVSLTSSSELPPIQSGNAREIHLSYKDFYVPPWKRFKTSKVKLSLEKEKIAEETALKIIDIAKKSAEKAWVNNFSDLNLPLIKELNLKNIADDFRWQDFYRSQIKIYFKQIEEEEMEEQLAIALML